MARQSIARLRRSGPTLIALAALFLSTNPAHAQVGNDPPHCVDVKAGGEIPFQGRKLVETPDITATEIRLANVLVSSRCWNRADAVLADYAQRHPDDYRVFFVYARIAWIGGQRSRAEAMARMQMKLHPEFTSMQVLLASMHIEDGQFDQAITLLDAIEAARPNDLWAYIDRLRIEAALMPTPRLGDTLRDIAKDTRFPPSARGQAAETARLVPDPGSVRNGEIFGSLMEDPVLATDCRLVNRAEELLETRGDAAGAAAVLEKYAGKNIKCFGTPRVRTLLAHSYLIQAAAIAPAPAPATRLLYDKARAVLQDDFTPLALRLAYRPTATALLRGYLSAYVDYRAADESGTTLLCTSIAMLNVDMVQLALEHGARVDQMCDDLSVVNRVLFQATSEHVRERQAVLQSLLEHGAEADGMEFCASPDNGDCRDVLLPILKKYGGRKPVTKT